MAMRAVHGARRLVLIAGVAGLVAVAQLGFGQDVVEEPDAADVSEQTEEGAAAAALEEADTVAADMDGGGEVGNDVAEPAAALPVAVHCGRITDVDVSSGAVDWCDLQDALRARRFKVGRLGSAEKQYPREPGEGSTFAILSVSVRPGRSLGRYDYALDVGGTTCACLALGAEGEAFDARRWEVVADARAEVRTRMLFEVPADAASATLEFALPVTVQPPGVILSLGGQPGAGLDASVAAPAAAGTFDDGEPVREEGDGVDDEAEAAQPKATVAADTTETPAMDEDGGDAAAEEPPPQPAKEAEKPKKDAEDDWF